MNDEFWREVRKRRVEYVRCLPGMLTKKGVRERRGEGMGGCGYVCDWVRKAQIEYFVKGLFPVGYKACFLSFEFLCLETNVIRGDIIATQSLPENFLGGRSDDPHDQLRLPVRHW